MLIDNKILFNRITDLGYKDYQDYRNSNYFNSLKASKLLMNSRCQCCGSKDKLDVYHSKHDYLKNEKLEINYLYTVCKSCKTKIDKRQRRNPSKRLQEIFDKHITIPNQGTEDNFESQDIRIKNELRLSKLSPKAREKYADKMLSSENFHATRGWHKINQIVSTGASKKLKGRAEEWRKEYLRLPENQREQIKFAHRVEEFRKVGVRSVLNTNRQSIRRYKSISEVADITGFSPFKLYLSIKNDRTFSGRKWEFIKPS